MEQWITNFANHHGSLLYLVIIVWTFLEGETVVVVTGALISSGLVHLSMWTLVLCAFVGSAAGDQSWFYIGRTYGTPLLKRWPHTAGKVEWAMRLLTKHENLLILSFRFIYGLRNISPFIMGMTGVSRRKFIALNLVSALVWSLAFTWGGFSIGTLVDTYLTTGSQWVNGLIIGSLVVAGFSTWLRQREKAREQIKKGAGTPS